ncbi:hypothetical protein E0F26_09515 [Candidatus Paraluminiphilus aquimaris]|uniref:Lipoprotein n=1 Tax=Candidatus Paraluminiphilus aquimaris TaxID=2518994 RepID=A0ABY6Q6Q0_9GAMM|nr:hypothetical protein [Candidatus Paraluminiphilus aquimaris]UZP74957.1 hypothetical protein E0F26_09515 [Candidatus Paraluminiphilus aquimaris]
MRTITLLALAFIAACGSIQQSQRVLTGGVEIGGVMVAGVGDTILEVKKEESMPNVFGKADMYGRKRATGVTYLTYDGVLDGKASFLRRDIGIASEKTTMNSSPIVIPNTSTSTITGSLNGQPIYGTLRSSVPPTVIPASAPTDQISGTSQTLLRVTPDSSEPLIIEGHMLTVIEASENLVRFTIEKLK